MLDYNDVYDLTLLLLIDVSFIDVQVRGGGADGLLCGHHRPSGAFGAANGGVGGGGAGVGGGVAGTTTTVFAAVLPTSGQWHVRGE
jgi:hypothetical protein